MRLIFFGWLAGCHVAPVDRSEDLDDTDLAGADGLAFAAVDNGLNQLVFVDEIHGLTWTTPLGPGPRDLHLVGDALLVSESWGYRRVALADGAVLEVVDAFAGVQSAVPLEGGGVLLASQSGRDVVLSTLDAAGAVVRTVTVPDHPELRLVRPLADGHVLLTTDQPGDRVVEVDADGAEVWEAALPGKGYVAERVGSSTFATTGGDARLVQLNADAGVVKSWGGVAAHPELGLVWASGFQRLSGDAVMLTNWLGHGDWGTAPHLVVLSADDELVWSWEDHEAAKQVTNALVVAAQGLPTP